MYSSLCRGLLCVVSAGWIMIGITSAQAPRNDLQERKVLEAKVAYQKLAAEVDEALEAARGLAKKSESRAADVLSAMLKRVEAADVLSQEQRTALSRKIKSRLNFYGGGRESRPVDKDVEREIRKLEAEAREAEDKPIQEEMRRISELRRLGRTAEANRRADDLARRYPNNPAALAGRMTTGITGAIGSAQDIKNQTNGGFVGAMGSVVSIPPPGDYTLPKDWSEKLKRKSLNQPVLTKKEQAIMKALARPTSVDFDKVGFTDAIQALSDKFDTPIIVDKMALEEGMLTPETQVSLKLNKVAGRTALKRLLAEFGLSYIIKNESIQVMSAEKAKEQMVTRTYYVGNLLAGGMFEDAGIRFVPGLQMIQAQQNMINIVNLIQTIDPDSWEANGRGGKGTITFYAPAMALIVRNSAEVHGMIGLGSSNK